MKSYTDIEQSRKLAEILPIESADMYYWCGEDLRIGGYRAMDIDYDIPCWSFSALLDIIRKTIGGYSMDCISKNIVMSVELGDKPWKLETDTYSNEIDNCYDMILKLYEEGLIMTT